MFVVEAESEGAGDPALRLALVPGTKPAPGVVSRALAGNTVVLRPQPSVFLVRSGHPPVPWIPANIEKFLLQIRLPADEPIMRFLFPHMLAADPGLFVDPVRRRGLDAVENFPELVENRTALRVLGFDLRLDEQVHVIRHHACGIDVVLAETLSVQDAFEDDVAVTWRKRALRSG